MNNRQKQEYITINDNKRKYIDPMTSNKVNVVNLDTGNTLEHELKKAEIAYKLIQEGHTILTEAKLLNGKKPDIMILSLSNPIIYEIMVSETDERCDSKDYLGIRIIKVKTK